MSIHSLPLRRASRRWSRFVLPRLTTGAAVLTPLRLFIGLGWLRAFAEKAIEPAWYDGAAVAAFLHERLALDEVAFPAYAAIIDQVFLPHAAVLGWIIMIGQLLAGLAVTAGAFTRLALLGGLFMNLNFILAGAPTPSAFYIVIQATLLATNAGTILGLDAWLNRRRGARRLPRSRPRATTRRNQHGLIAGGLASLTIAGYAFLHARDLSPGGSVHDPAVLLAILGGLGALWALLAAISVSLRQTPAPRSVVTPSRSRHRTGDAVPRQRYGLLDEDAEAA